MVKGRTGQRVRLYVRGTILGFKRSKSNQYENTSLVQIEGVNTKEDVAWYGGKRLAYVYKAKTKSNGTHYRCLWGKITRPHGNSGVVRAQFKSKSNQYENTSLVQIEGVNTKEDVAWYGGKRLAYVYKAKTKSNGTHYRCLWGKITRPHGNSGVVRAQFKSNLPAESMGRKVRVFMYPSSI
ncbi:hypothetical protein ZWY2020_050102 [Hordeum vulgare]|nr:hypothetical protein ZWY2020_050102 [Hordeum vulgare]